MRKQGSETFLTLKHGNSTSIHWHMNDMIYLITVFSRYRITDLKSQCLPFTQLPDFPKCKFSVSLSLKEIPIFFIKATSSTQYPNPIISDQQNIALDQVGKLMQT